LFIEFLPQVTKTPLMNQILIADEMHPSLFAMLTQAGFSFVYEPKLTRAEIMTQIAPFEGLIIRSKTTVDEELLNHAPNLRYIGRAGAGLDLIDLQAISRRNIQVFHAGAGNRDAVAEHTVGLLLGLITNIVKADREVRNNIWDREGNRGYELGSMTVGIIGYGNNGQATAQRLSGFGCSVLCYDKFLTDYGNDFATAVSMEILMAESDVISLHIPLTDDTRGMINSDFIARVQKPFYLLNIARGEIVVLADVMQGLQNGKIRGAGLDVLENEKLAKLTPSQQAAFDYLRTSNRVILTPHVAGWTHESYVRINEVLVKQFLSRESQKS
jgi:D-3-phosphoglycerate dehydrogenase / 2-oxoglutarate reductase